MKIKPNDKLMFIGDSITDADRDYGEPEDLGQGYVTMIAEALQQKFPGFQLSFRNQGINGDTLAQLKRRWDRDCVSWEPDIVSIFIGINDIWNFHYRFENVSPQYWADFKQDYWDILHRLDETIGSQIILIKPYALPHPQERSLWSEDLSIASNIIDDLSSEFGGRVVNLMPRLLAYGQSLGFQAITGVDGIHPTPFGHSIICQEWLKQIGI